MRLLTVPGVFAPRSDSLLLAAIVAERTAPGDSVLDPFTGSGVLALAAAEAGAEATAIDVSLRAVVCTRVNAAINGLSVRAVRGDRIEAAGDATWDTIVANPPYVPGADEEPAGAARAWEGGHDGRRFIDRLCAEAPERLSPGGRLLLVHSSLCGERQTLDRLAAGGLSPSVVARRPGQFGPLVAGRLGWLRENGICAPDQIAEEVLVFEAVRPR